MDREYTFDIRIRGENLRSFSLMFDEALRIHNDLCDSAELAGVHLAPVADTWCCASHDATMASPIQFPAWRKDARADMIHDDANVERRRHEMVRYYTAVLNNSGIVNSEAYRQCVTGTAMEGLDLGSLHALYCKPFLKVSKDPGLVKRAMEYLRITGEVLIPCGVDTVDSIQLDLRADLSNTASGTSSLASTISLSFTGSGGTVASTVSFENRVFLKPEWLVNVMKELVRHDLEQLVEKIDHSAVDNAEGIQKLGRKFVRDGELHRQLLPWLW
eukprot:COSAG06_NODE_8436_length_2175_cov_1.380539_1_plen_272_part_10